jgi:hypothetical protein
MLRPYLLTLTLLLSATGLSYADSVYNITVNTSALAGTQGSIDFQFNFGNGETQGATATISNPIGGTNGTQTPTGDVTGGPFPAPVAISNGYTGGVNDSGYNDYFETFTYGKTLLFSVTLGGPAVNAPDGFSTGNSEFFFSMFTDVNGLDPAPGTDSNGVAGTLTVNPNGSITAVAVSPNFNSSFVPEPASFWLTLGAGLILLSGVLLRRHKLS